MGKDGPFCHEAASRRKNQGRVFSEGSGESSLLPPCLVETKEICCFFGVNLGQKWQNQGVAAAS